jgi:hypothetical protein
MPFPPVDYCLLCEDVRSEPGNKVTVLGFFGLLPKVGVILEPDEIFVQIAFLVMFGEGSGEYLIIPRILTPSNTVLIAGKPVSVKIHPKASGTGVSFSFQGLQLDMQGSYSFQLTAQEKEVYRAPFNVRRGEIPTYT